jgi:hypothetical protein
MKWKLRLTNHQLHTYGFYIENVFPETSIAEEVGSVKVMGPPVDGKVAIYIDEKWHDGNVSGRSQSLLAWAGADQDLKELAYQAAKAFCENRVAKNPDNREFVDDTERARQSELEKKV